jgi:hypothetical protein
MPAAGARRQAATITAAASGNGASYDYDLVTIGAGSGGVRGSRFASSYGAPGAVLQTALSPAVSRCWLWVGVGCMHHFPLDVCDERSGVSSSHIPYVITSNRC